MSWPWREGNSVQLLENGEEYFPAVFDAIARARREVLLETFILFDDPVGRELREHLTNAARRGVQCHLLLDGYGSPRLSEDFVGELVELGVSIHYFDQVKRYFGKTAQVFRRMHRKLVVVDGEEAFCGGINFSEEHLHAFGELSKQDYMVRLRGPVVRDIREVVRSFPDPGPGPDPGPSGVQSSNDGASAGGASESHSEARAGESEVRLVVGAGLGVRVLRPPAARQGRARGP